MDRDEISKAKETVIFIYCTSLLAHLNEYQHLDKINLSDMYDALIRLEKKHFDFIEGKFDKTVEALEKGGNNRIVLHFFSVTLLQKMEKIFIELKLLRPSHKNEFNQLISLIKKFPEVIEEIPEERQSESCFLFSSLTE